MKACAFFLSQDIRLHAATVQSGISCEAALYIARHLRTNCNDGEALDFLIRIYAGSGWFDDADNYFDVLIAPFLGCFTERQLIAIVQASNNNSQIYGRRKAASANRMIKNQLRKIKPDFDFTPYANF